MATSGVTTFSVTRDQLITDAFLEMSVITPIETPSAGMISYATRALNMLIVSKRVREQGLWLNQRFTMALAYQVAAYNLGPTGWHATPGDMNETAIATAGLSGDSSIIVDSISGISASDYIGIELADGTMQWTTVNGVPAGSTINLTDVLTGSVNVDAVVRTYTTKISRPLGIVDLNVVDTSGNELSMSKMARADYEMLPLKTSLGKPVQYYFDPQTGNAILNIWPTSDRVSDKLQGTLKVPVQIFVNASDEPDFPIEWYRALKFGLAVDMSAVYKVPNDVFQKLALLARDALDDVEGFDSEDASVQMAPDLGW